MNIPNDPLFPGKSPWLDNTNSIWLASTIALNRNLEKFNFPAKLSTDKKKQIVSLLSKEFLASPLLQTPRLLKGEEMSPLHKERLVEHFLTETSFQQAYSGEAFVLDNTGEFMAELNIHDHLTLYMIDVKEELEACWNRVLDLEMALNKTVSYAFSPQFGFLTADPTECGTGLLVHIFLHLPALMYMDRLDDLLKKYNEDGILYTGIQGDPEEIIGDVAAFCNKYTLGVTEENIMTSMRGLATKLVMEEKAERSRLKKETEHELTDLKDRVSRAYGILLHSYQLEAVEALDAASLLKLGLDLGWVNSISHASLNSLFFHCRRAHLLGHFDKEVSQEELSHKRAEYVHQSLKGVQLLI